MANASTDSLDLSPAFIALRTTSYIILGLLIVSGNILSIAVTRRVSNLADSTKVLMTTLAAYDLLVGLLVMSAIFSSALDRWPFGTLACKISVAVNHIACMTSVSILTSLNVERYIAVTRPYKFPIWCTRRRVVIHVLVTSTFTLVASVLAQILGVSAKYYVASATCFYNINSKFAEMLALFLIGIFPLSMITCIYYRLIKISQHHELRSNQNAHNEVNAIQNKALKAFLLITLIFAICYFPTLIIRTLISYTGVDNLDRLQFILPLLSFSNSAWNVFIYSLFNRSYRQMAKKIIKERFPCYQGSVVPVDA